MEDKKEKIAQVAQFMTLKKSDLVDAWVTKKSVAQILSKYGIDPKSFSSDIGLKIIEYFVKVLRQEAKVGRCPIMDKFVELMFEKRIRIDEVFLICMGFRWALFSQIAAHWKLGKEDIWIVEVLFELFDQNLSGVLRHFDELLANERLQKQKEENMKEHIRRLQKILDIQEQAIFKVRKNRLFLGNRAFYEMVGTAGLEEFRQRYPDLWSFIAKVDCFESLFEEKNYDEWFKKSIRERDGKCDIELFDHRSGRDAKIEMTILPMEERETEDYIIVMHDVTEHRQQLASMKRMVYTDALTQVPNRRKFMEIMTRFLKQCKTEKRTFFLLLLDIHNLTEINEVHGRDTGDLILKRFAKQMMGLLDEKSLFARIDGDRFALVTESMDSKGATRVANKILNQLHSIYYRKDEHIKGNVAIVSCQMDDDIAAMLSRGDRLIQRIIEKGSDTIMDDALLVEEDRKIKAAAEAFFDHCRTLYETRQPLEIVNYFLEVPIDSKAQIVKMIGDSIWVKLRHVAVHVLQRGSEVYIKTEKKPYFKAVVEDLDKEKFRVRLGNFTPVAHSPLDREKVSVRLIPSIEAILRQGVVQLPVEIETISVDTMEIFMIHISELGEGNDIEITTTLRWNERNEDITLYGHITKANRSGPNVRIVVELENRKTVEDVLTPFVAYRQLEIIKELKESMFLP